MEFPSKNKSRKKKSEKIRMGTNAMDHSQIRLSTQKILKCQQINYEN